MNEKKNTLMVAAFAKVTAIMLFLGLFATTILLLGLFAPTLACAATPQEQYQTVQEEYQTSQVRVQEAQQSYQESREKFFEARAHLEDSRTSATIFDMKNATRNFLLHTIDYTILRLEVLEARAIRTEDSGFAPFTISDNIEDYIDQLEGLKDDVEEAETSEDFRAVIREIRDIWQHADLESRYFILGAANNRVDSFLDRGESISDRIEAEIERLSDAGVDTTELERLLKEYNKALKDAKDTHEEVTKLFEKHNGFDDDGVLEDADKARQFLNEASSLMRETHQQLKDVTEVLREIFAELKQHRPGSADLSGTGTLTASGNGKATMSGNMEVEISAHSGVLTITDYDGNAEVDVTGYGTKEDLGNGAVRYSGFDGTASISGSSITIVILGDDIELTADGTGSAVLRGYGTYDVEKDGRHISSNDWAPQVQTVSQAQYQAGYMNQTQIQNKTLFQNQTQNLVQVQNQTLLQNTTQNQIQVVNKTPDKDTVVDIGGS